MSKNDKTSLPNIRFLLIANKLGQPRVSKYYVELDDLDVRISKETEIIKKCTARAPSNCNFFNHESFKVVYRRYKTLFVIVGISKEENELAIYESIHVLMDAVNTYNAVLNETDLTEEAMMFQLDKIHMIIDELFLGGDIIETNKRRILEPIGLIEVHSLEQEKALKQKHGATRL